MVIKRKLKNINKLDEGIVRKVISPLQVIRFPIKKKHGQFQIQQMAFMIMAIFIFFTLTGLFILRVSMGGLNSDAQDLKREKAISFLSTIPKMTELNFKGSCVNCLDIDKIKIFSDYGAEYKRFFPLDSLKAFRVYPIPNNTVVDKEMICPSADCIILFDSQNTSIQEYATFVSVCEGSKRSGIFQEKCEIWKLVGGIKIKN
jgi:hypothetical protein